MKKRILVLLLAVVCLVSFAACGEKQTPYSLYTTANEAMTTVTGMEAKVTMDMSSTYDGETETFSVNMTIKSNGDDMAITTSMEEEGDMSIVYVGGVMYMDMEMMEETIKMKSEISIDEFKEEYDTGSATIPELTEEDFANAELTKDGDITSFTLSLNEEKAKKFLNDSLFGGYFGDGEEELNIPDLKMTFSFNKESVLTKMEISATITSPEEENASATVNMTYEFINLGTAPTITAPEDADEYLSMDDMIGGMLG